MALSPTSSRGGTTLPLSVSSTPVGTKLIVDEFGDLIVVGKDGNPGHIGVSAGANEQGNTVNMDTNFGVSATQLDMSVKDALGGVLGSIERRGYIIIAVNAAPADGDLDAAQAWLWYDDTNGAGKLMVKAKQADGTVKTGSFNVNT